MSDQPIEPVLMQVDVQIEKSHLQVLGQIANNLEAATGLLAENRRLLAELLDSRLFELSYETIDASLGGDDAGEKP